MKPRKPAPNAGRPIVPPVVFSSTYAFDSTAELVAESARRKSLELVTSVSPDIPEPLLGDPGRLRQVLFNLAANAVEFTE